MHSYCCKNEDKLKDMVRKLILLYVFAIFSEIFIRDSSSCRKAVNGLIIQISYQRGMLLKMFINGLVGMLFCLRSVPRFICLYEFILIIY